MAKPAPKKSEASKGGNKRVEKPKGPPVIFPKVVKVKEVPEVVVLQKPIFHTGFATQWRVDGAKYPNGLSQEWGAYAREAIRNQWGDWSVEAREPIATWALKASQYQHTFQLSEAENAFFGGPMTRGHFVGRIQFWVLAADMLSWKVLQDPEQKEYDHMSDMWSVFKTRDTAMFTALVSDVVSRVGNIADKFLKEQINERTGYPVGHMCVIDFNLGAVKFQIVDKDISKVKSRKVIDRNYVFENTGCGIAFFDETESRFRGWKTQRHYCQPKGHWTGQQYRPKEVLPRGPVVRPR